jgi:hypothetical protein
LKQTRKFQLKGKKGFERRIRVLEALLSSEPIILYLPDGTLHKICGREAYGRRLFSGAFQSAELGPTLASDLELIRSAVTIREPAGTILDLLRAILNSPFLETDDKASITRSEPTIL